MANKEPKCKCAAPNCNNNNTRKSLSWHLFPKDETLRNKWIENMNAPNYKLIGNNSRLCSEHFTPDCYIRDPFITSQINIDSSIKLKCRLKSGACPTNFTRDAIESRGHLYMDNSSLQSFERSHSYLDDSASLSFEGNHSYLDDSASQSFERSLTTENESAASVSSKRTQAEVDANAEKGITVENIAFNDTSWKESTTKRMKTTPRSKTSSKYCQTPKKMIKSLIDKNNRVLRRSIGCQVIMPSSSHERYEIINLASARDFVTEVS